MEARVTEVARVSVNPDHYDNRGRPNGSIAREPGTWDSRRGSAERGEGRSDHQAARSAGAERASALVIIGHLFAASQRWPPHLPS